VNGTWSFTDSKLLLTLEGQDTITSDYKFSNNNRKLTLTDGSGNIGIFTKQ